MKNFNIEFETQHTANTIDDDNPDLEAFVSNSRAIIQARELGQNAPLVSKLYSNASDPQLVRVSSKRCLGVISGFSAKMTLNKNPTAAHHLIASLICIIHHMILKHSQNGSSKGRHIWAAVEEQYLPTVSVPVHHTEFFYILK